MLHYHPEYARQDREEDTSLPGGTLHADPTSLGFDQTPGQGEAQARSLILLGHARIELLELDEEVPQVFGLDADARIHHLQAEGVLPFPSQPDGHLSLFGCEFDGIGEIV